MSNDTITPTERPHFAPIRHPAYDSETETIRGLAAQPLLSPAERAALDRSRKRGDKLAVYVVIGVIIFFAAVALLARAS